MKLPLILPVPLLAPAFVSIFAPKTTPKVAQPADLDRIGYDTIKNAPPEAGKEARAANLAALFGGDLSAVPRMALTVGVATVLAAEEVHLVEEDEQRGVARERGEGCELAVGLHGGPAEGGVEGDCCGEDGRRRPEMPHCLVSA